MKDFDAGASNTLSKVGERLLWLTGRKCYVRVAYAEIGQIGGETFNAVYEDTLPLGREYFFVFNISGRRRLIRTSAVIEIGEIEAPPLTSAEQVQEDTLKRLAMK